MNNNEQFGFVSLAKKSLAVITASLSALAHGEAKAVLAPPNLDDGNKDVTYEMFQKRNLKPKLVLKIISNNPDRFAFAQHGSHSSHSSHASHASHYSSSSSNTSSTPSDTAAAETPSSYTPTPPPPSNQSRIPNSTETSEPMKAYSLGSRTLFEGCEGTDVKELQKLLKTLGYDVPETGYFGDKTDAAVKSFQKSKELNPNGKVDSQTLAALRKQ